MEAWLLLKIVKVTLQVLPHHLIYLNPWFSKPGLWTNSTSTACRLDGKANSQTPACPRKTETVGRL